MALHYLGYRASFLHVILTALEGLWCVLPLIFGG
jgi:hypothetical protein